MRRAALCFLIGACASPAQRPSTTATRDIWQPFASLGQEGVSGGALAMDGDAVWFIATQDRDTSQGSLFLTQVTPDGDTVVAPTNVDGPGPQILEARSLVVTNQGVLVGFDRDDPMPDEGTHPYVRIFDHDGVATTKAAARVPVVVGGTTAGSVAGLALTAASDGHVRMFTSLTAMTNEVALVDLDATGTPTGTTVAAGTPDGNLVGTLGTAALADGSTLLAWDHGEAGGCTGPGLPFRTMTAVVDPAWNLSAPVMISDSPDRQDMAPVVASKGGAAYIAWTDLLADGEHSWLAPYAATNAAIEIPAAERIVLDDAAHGALVWISSGSMLNVQPFTNTGNGLTLGDLHAYPPVDPSTEIYASLTGAVSLGGTRYLLAWEEKWLDYSAPTRIYATIVDLAAPAPPAMPDRGTPRLRSRPCI